MPSTLNKPLSGPTGTVLATAPTGGSQRFRILRWLEESISSGELAAGDPIPAERALAAMFGVARNVNILLQELFHKAGIELVDTKIEFGRASDNGHIIISDEISPDTCRLWDEADGNRLDKDRFRLDLSDVVASYRSVLDRLNKVVKEES